MKNYFDFLGKAKRQEFWAVTLLAFPLWILSLLSVALLSALFALIGPIFSGFVVVVGILGATISVVWLVLATTARRCRDIDISTLWCILMIIPVINFYFWIVAGVLPSVEKNENNF